MNNILRPLAFWHEDQGPALFWRAPVSEPPYAGTPLDSDWPFKPDDVVVWLPCPSRSTSTSKLHGLRRTRPAGAESKR